MDLVYPDVSSGAVLKEALDHNLPQPNQMINRGRRRGGKLNKVREEGENG